MIHRFVDLLEARYPDIPVLAIDNIPTLTHTIWQIGNRATPYRMEQTATDSADAANIRLGDPQREPVTGDYVVYSRFNISGTQNQSVRLVDWADTTDIQLYTEASGSGNSRSLQPTWAPDGTKILFRAKGAGTAHNLLKTMNPDGSGVSTIYTGAAEIEQPLYSSDGTKIAWTEGTNLIKTANADGTGAATVYTSPGVVFGVAWKHGSNVLAFRDSATAAFTSDERWRIMNADGTGLTTWLTISRAAGYGPSDGDPSSIMYSWLESDTQIATTVREIAHADPDARLTLVTSGGNNYISPARYAPVNTGSPDTRPVALTGRLEGVERILFVGDGNPSGVVSVLPDGSDYRTDWDGTGVSGGSTFHGFRGDTLNV